MGKIWLLGLEWKGLLQGRGEWLGVEVRLVVQLKRQRAFSGQQENGNESVFRKWECR